MTVDQIRELYESGQYPGEDGTLLLRIKAQRVRMRATKAYLEKYDYDPPRDLYDFEAFRDTSLKNKATET